MSKLRVLDLFSGIGGFSLGLERTGGFETVAFCEIEPYCRRVLAKHWPHVPCYTDVRELTADTLRRDGIAVDAICGGFPCQDVSLAGDRAGLEGSRSGLWTEYARLIGELRPLYVIVENVSGLLSLGMGDVLGRLSALGYDAAWDCIPACAVGAPHRRDRVWIVAHSISDQLRKQPRGLRGPNRPYSVLLRDDGAPQSLADADCTRSQGRISAVLQERSGERPAGQSGSLLYTDSPRPHAPAQRGVHRAEEGAGAWDGESERSDWWLTEPDVGRVANGIPSRVDRIKSLGNAVVPQVVETIGRAILEAAA